jgi:hypothetical protein
MAVTGHRTRSVFERDNIVSDRDLRDVAAKVAGPNGYDFGLTRGSQRETRRLSPDNQSVRP